jgi:hypothetical protein
VSVHSSVGACTSFPVAHSPRRFASAWQLCWSDQPFGTRPFSGSHSHLWTVSIFPPTLTLA